MQGGRGAVQQDQLQRSAGAAAYGRGGGRGGGVAPHSTAALRCALPLPAPLPCGRRRACLFRSSAAWLTLAAPRLHRCWTQASASSPASRMTPPTASACASRPASPPASQVRPGALPQQRAAAAQAACRCPRPCAVHGLCTRPAAARAPTPCMASAHRHRPAPAAAPQAPPPWLLPAGPSACRSWRWGSRCWRLTQPPASCSSARSTCGPAGGRARQPSL